MSPAEIVWRAGFAARIPFEWLNSEYSRSPVRESAETPNTYPVREHNCGGSIDCVRIFDLEFPVGYEFDWHRDYRHGVVAPRRFSRLLNLRNTSTIGDVKYIWECNRHQFLSALAYSTDQDLAKAYIICCLDSWITANPYLKGINWTSSLELALRIISWALAFPAVENLLTTYPARFNRFSQSVNSHLLAINRNFSLHSSANNHLIGEAAGLYIGAVCFPWWSESPKWKQTARSILENEIIAQVTSDGVNREQATSYHLFTLELFLLAYLIGYNVGDKYSDEYLQRLHAMLLYIYTIATPTGAVPWFGDSDDGRGFLCSAQESNIQVLMDLGGLLFDEPEWLQFSGSRTSASLALLPAPVQGASTGRQFRSCTSRGLFKEAGIGVLDDGNGTKLIMDFGPLGYTAIAAHGHADALSVVLALGNDYFLIDPGTYAYHSHPEWRDYFRSTAAHNTARVDGLDQSIMAGPFLWKLKAESRMLSYEDTTEEGMIVAEHYGYERLSDPVTHRRAVRFDKRRSEITIADSFSCRGKHDVEVFFHLHSEAKVVRTEDRRLEVHWRDRRIVFTNPGQTVVHHIYQGHESPIVGWCSTAFNKKQSAPTLRVSAIIKGSTSITSTLQLGYL
jgi:hypothetical protein